MHLRSTTLIGNYLISLTLKNSNLNGVLCSRNHPEIKTSKARVAQGSSHFLAIASDGSLYEWGRDSYGEFSSSKPKTCRPLVCHARYWSKLCFKTARRKVYCYSYSSTYSGELGRGELEALLKNFLP